MKERKENKSSSFLKISKLKNETKIDLEHHHFATFNKIIDLGNDHQWLIKLSGGKMVENFIKG